MTSAVFSRAACASLDGIVSGSSVFVFGEKENGESFHGEEVAAPACV